MFYRFNFTGDYHERADGSHEVRLIHRDKDGNETAYCEGEVVPEYAVEITTEEAPTLGIVQKVPEEITKYQAMEAMKAHGIWDSFKALKATNEEIAEVWDIATAVKRTFSMIEDMKIAFNLTDEQIDNMFIEASRI